MMKYILLFLFATAALAKPPPGADPNSEIYKWFDRQRDMMSGSCCGQGDGHQLEDNQWRISGSDYEVYIDQKWHRIAKPMFLLNAEVDPNPTQHAVVWYSYDSTMPDGLHLYCFAPGYGT